jgi:hypothetical protein
MLRNLLGTGERRDRDESDIGLGVIPNGLQEQGQLLDNLVVSRDNMLVSVMLEIHESQVVTHRALSHATVAISIASSQRGDQSPRPCFVLTVIHLVDHYNKLVDTVRLYQQRVPKIDTRHERGSFSIVYSVDSLSGLSTLLETGLEFSFSCRDDESGKIGL